MLVVARWRWCGGLPCRWTSSRGLSGSVPDRLLPGRVRELVFDLSGELSGGLAEHREVPQQGIAALAVGFQLADGDIGGQLLGLLGCIDHLAEQEDVTLHRQAEPRPGLTVSASDAGHAEIPDLPDG